MVYECFDGFGFCMVDVCFGKGFFINEWCVVFKGVNCYFFWFDMGCILIDE